MLTQGKVLKVECQWVSGVNTADYFLTLSLLVCGDIHPCPGPPKSQPKKAAPNWKHPCQICAKPVKKNQYGICCDSCNLWSHTKCISMDMDEYTNYSSDETLTWFCHKCLMPFTDSFFELSESSLSCESSTTCDSLDNPETLCTNLKRKHLKNGLLCYININSVRYKLPELKPLVHILQPVCFTIAETKLDNSFTTNQLLIDGYHPPFRKDRDQFGGGLLCYIRSDIPCRAIEVNTTALENILIETYINGQKWLIASLYKSPSKVSDHEFIKDFEAIAEYAMSMYDNFVTLGDLNYDLNLPEKSRPLKDLMELYVLHNLVKESTFIHRNGSSLIDVALTNVRNKFSGSEIIDVGCSDGHSMITCVLKSHIPKPQPRTITYRSYKSFDETQYKSDMESIPFSVCSVFDDPSDQLWCYEMLVSDIINEHAPLKTKKVRHKEPPFMHHTLKKECHE